MRKEYKRIGDYIELVDERNKDLAVDLLLGLTINKQFIPSVANTVGANMKNYKIIRKNQFACSTMQVRRDKKMPIAILKEFDEAIISQAYPVFKVIDEQVLNPDYLMMWFTRQEFDRQATFHAVGGVRGSIEWVDFLDFELPIPSIEKQREIVAEYQAVENKIKTNEQICEKLEAAAQALYKHWFVDFEFPNEEDMPYKSSGGAMVYNEELEKEIPEGWEVKSINEVSALRYGKMLNSNLFKDSGFPVFSGYGIRGYYDEYMYEKPQILVLCRGVSGTGRVELSPEFAYITNLSIVLEININTVAKGYYYYYLKNDNLRSLDSGSAQSQITINDLGKRKTIIPSINIQTEFQTYFDAIYNYKKNINKESLMLSQLQELLLARIVISNERYDNVKNKVV